MNVKVYLSYDIKVTLKLIFGMKTSRFCHYDIMFVCLFVFVALRPMSTAMVIAGRSVHLTTLFPGQA